MTTSAPPPPPNIPSSICSVLCPVYLFPLWTILHLLCSMPSLSFSTLDITIPFICIDWIDLHQHTLPLQLLHCKHWLLISLPPTLLFFSFFFFNFSALTIFLCVDVGDVWSYVCIRVDEEKLSVFVTVNRVDVDLRAGWWGCYGGGGYEKELWYLYTFWILKKRKRILDQVSFFWPHFVFKVCWLFLRSSKHTKVGKAPNSCPAL